jgi:cytidylate kinase
MLLIISIKSINKRNRHGKDAMNTTSLFHITIARQLGSGGRELGQRIARRLGLAYLDRQILQNAAEELGMTEDELAHREERIQSFWIRMLEAYASSSPEYTLGTPPLKVFSDDRLIDAEKHVLLRLCSRGPCVIVGRCGFWVLKDQARLLNVFVHAPRWFRIERMIKFYGAQSPEAADEMIDQTDRDRQRYVEKLTGCSWYDARNYHLTFDLAEIGFEAATETIASAASHLQAAPQGS